MAISLPQHANAYDRFQREHSLAAQRAQYEWVHRPGMPPFCKGVPAPERFTARARDRMKFDIEGSMSDAAFAFLSRMRARPDSLSEYDAFYKFRRKPSVAERWLEDREFARQRLDGINPLLIRRVDEFPRNFPITHAHVANVLPSGERLEALRDEGRLYLVDHGVLEGVPKALGRFQEAPISLYWLDRSNTLMPLAIQLGQSVESAPVIFTPADLWWVWLTARTFVQCAEGTYHEIISHLTRTHLVVEPFWVAAARTLPPQHPVYGLLRPHFTGTININQEARDELIVPGGPIDETIAVGTEGAYWLTNQTYQSWTFEDMNPQADMERRGVLSRDELPGYHYRDDAIALWDAISTFVEQLLHRYYRGDADVQEDTELQAWVAELVDDRGGRIRGLPLQNQRLVRFQDLHAVIRQIIFNCSAEHAAVNNGQYDLFGFIPNAPGAMYVPAPRTKAPRSEAEFTYGLPGGKAAVEQIALVHLLSEPTVTPLGVYDDDFFESDPGALLALDRFRSALDDLAIAIELRNRRLEVPYTYLRPSEVGRSIAI